MKMHCQSSLFRNNRNCRLCGRHSQPICEKKPENDKCLENKDKDCDKGRNKIKGSKKGFWLYPFIGFGGVLKALKFKNPKVRS